MSIKSSEVQAKLTIKLFAGDALVKETHDETMWTALLSKIVAMENNARPETPAIKVIPSYKTFGADPILNSSVLDDGYEAAFARELNISIEDIKGACRPRLDAPYILLDHKYYESYKSNAPSRGVGSVAPIALAATLLCILFKAAQIEQQPKLADAHKILKTINVQDHNASRAIKNCDWLQSTQGNININPARYSKAISVARAYCTQNWNEYGQGK